MNTRVFGVLQGFTGAVDIFFAGAGQAANLGLLDQLCDLADALKIAIGGNWKTGLDNVDAHCVQNLGDTQFFPQRHGGAGRLLAVAQGGVKNQDAVSAGSLLFCLIGHVFILLKVRVFPDGLISLF